MKRILSSVLLFLCFITLSSATDKAHKVEDIPMVHLQNKLRYVSNPDGVLSEATVMDKHSLWLFGKLKEAIASILLTN